MHHLILYDGTCGLCHAAVRWVLKKDKSSLFRFAPLQGTTAQSLKLLLPKESVDSLILIESWKGSQQKAVLFGQASLTILALLYRWPLLAKLPGWLVNPPYRLIAYVRHHLFSPPTCLTPSPGDARFLP